LCGEAVRQNKQNLQEIDIELTAQQLLAPFVADDVLEIDDVIAVTTTCESEPAANTEAPNQALDETSEIELTAEQMDAMLEGRWPL
jgi:hypothetical protein